MRRLSDRSLFVGREADQAAVIRHLEEGAPLVTLLGPGGMGKTRLAVRCATAFTRDGRAWAFADLSEAKGSSGVLRAVAAAIGVSLADVASDEEATSRIGDALVEAPHRLLVLDNVEGVAAEVTAALDAWLDDDRVGRIVATSRVRIDRPEPVIELRGLSEEEGVRLYEAHARRRVPELVGDADTRELVRRLDGSPLAIELAAARAHVLPAAALIARFSRHLDLVSSGREERQGSLRAVVAASWALASEVERRALAAFSVFQGGFRLDAAEHVLGAVEGGVEASALIASLLDQSLLYLEPSAVGAHRYAMTESVRAFATHAAPEFARRARTAHAAWFLDRVAAGAPPDELATDRENLLAAFHAEPREALALEPLFAVGHSARSLHEIFASALDRVSDRAAPAVRAELMIACGLVERRLGRPEATLASIAEARSLAAGAGRLDLEAHALFIRGSAVGDTEGPRAARDAAEEAVDAARAAGRPALLAKALQQLAWFEIEVGDVRGAERHAADALAIAEDVGVLEVECLVHNLLGMLAISTAHWGDGEHHFERGLAAAEAMRSAVNAAIVRANHARLLVAQGELDRARDVATRALEGAQRGGFRRVEGIALLQLATLELELGRTPEARVRALLAERVLREVGYRKHHATALRLLGAIALDEARVDLAVESFERALVVAEGIADTDARALALAGLSAALARRRAPDEARAPRGRPRPSRRPPSRTPRASSTRGAPSSTTASTCPTSRRAEDPRRRASRSDSRGARPPNRPRTPRARSRRRSRSSLAWGRRAWARTSTRGCSICSSTRSRSWPPPRAHASTSARSPSRRASSRSSSRTRARGSTNHGCSRGSGAPGSIRAARPRSTRRSIAWPRSWTRTRTGSCGGTRRAGSSSWPRGRGSCASSTRCPPAPDSCRRTCRNMSTKIRGRAP
ncbi:MAG: AAA family ATPase [Polyangiaceae bacterium]